MNRNSYMNSTHRMKRKIILYIPIETLETVAIFRIRS